MLKKLSKSFIFLTFSAFFMLAGCNVKYISAPEKKTEELKDLTSKPENFHFWRYPVASPDKVDYLTEIEVLAAIFNVGTPETTINKVMEKAGAEIIKDSNRKCLTYYLKPKRFLIDFTGRPKIVMTFDKNRRLLDISSNGSRAFPKQPHYSDLYNKGECQ